MTYPLYAYRNGNTSVIIRSDGTKYRFTRNGETPAPEFPESIDVKMTNACDMGCEFCHESSSPSGAHAKEENIFPLLDSLEAGTELAIGGGNPLMFPFLENFLQHMKGNGVICNMTVHWKQFDMQYERIRSMVDTGLIRGVGVSVNEVVPCDVIRKIMTIPTAVVHVIAGIIPQAAIRQLSNRDLNILFLGYKDFGRGHMFKPRGLEENQKYIYDNIDSIFDSFRAVSFDNLAIIQLDLESVFTPDEWKTFYMGDDGQFTMYLDLVKNEYAASSVSERHPIDSQDIRDLFRNVREMKGF